MLLDVSEALAYNFRNCPKDHVARALLETRCHFRPPSVQAESCCDNLSTTISRGGTISSPLNSNRPTILIKPSKPLLET
ncbi:uncharacterized protein N7525_010753 [Penicillium rubens]|uniref:uncharacterized protein n=1 Tax=Penicillium rubens TaxID=1108849 RepID=UPI002A5A6D13|nr:uncharacterized protein N7525_010753 [Penicillium rubens]KAJ5821469.1 hypothetical protein N7525_010753 [Penicillium rubens]